MAGTQTPYSVYQDSTGNVNLFNFTITDTEAPSTLQDQFTAAGVAVPSNIDKIYYRGLAPMPRTGGTEITMNTTLSNIGIPQEIRFTYLTPQPETITGFYLDGTEYKFEGGGTEYNAGEGIEIKNGPDYSAMQGPCDEGFHIPSEADITLLLSVLNNLGITTKDQFSQYLKYPVDGSRDFDDGIGRWSRDYLGIMSCSAAIISGNLRIFSMSTNETLPLSGNYTSLPLTTREIRPFKNVSVSPTSSWTTLYDGSSVTAGAGIFHSATDGLISISSDGQNFITIADKNLGAINVYNYGDTITEDNGGKSFQWGNNYPFPYSDDITNVTRDTTDLSAYGPGNYYYSQTLFTNRSSWVDTSLNTNLRGGETGVVTLDNAITNTGVLSVNGQTGNVTISAGSEIVYCTQAEYDALPSSKLTDGKSYVIYE